MTTETVSKGNETVNRLTDCPYCGTNLRNKKPPAHFPCEMTPSTDEVIEALKELGIRL